MGVWIEIVPATEFTVRVPVTPLVGVWIEIPDSMKYPKNVHRHSPCGSVD